MKRSPTNSKKKSSSSSTTPPIKELTASAEEDPVTSDVTCKNCSGSVTASRSLDSDHDGGPSHPLNFRSLQIENGRSQNKPQLSPTNSNDHSTKKCMNCSNGGASSPSSASTASTGKVSFSKSSSRREKVARAKSFVEHV